jgi:serine/threonine protein kinase
MDTPTADNAPDALPAGTLLGRYEIVRLLGRGGMGSVYEALHRDLKKRVAIKTLLPALTANHEAKQRFLREGEAASRINHPNVVDITDVVADGPLSYLVMEYLEGEDLSKMIARRGGLSTTEAADIMLPVSAAIAAAHEQGVIHRDLKPENIFLSASHYGGMHPKVFDFGISKVLSDGPTMALTSTSATFGTAYYLPPEQLRGARQADAKSDQYALGTILYECLTGHRAFEGDNIYAILRSIGEGEYVPPRLRRPDLPPAMEAIIVRSMSLDPTARFDSVKHFGEALLDFASPGARAVWAPFFSGHTPPPPRPPGTTTDAGRTMMLPSDTGKLAKPTASTTGSGRRLQPPVPKATTTFRDATGETLIGDVRPARSRVPLLIGIGLVAAAGVAVLVLRAGGETATPAVAAATTTRPTPPAAEAPKSYQIQIATEPAAATIELDGRRVGSGSFSDALPADGAEHSIVARAPGYGEATVRFTEQAPPPRLLKLIPLPVPAEAPPVAADGREPAEHAAAKRSKPTKPSRPSAHAAGEPAAAHAQPAAPRAKKPPADGQQPNNAPIIE